MASRVWAEWPVVRQVAGADKLGRGAAARSRVTEEIAPRIRDALQLTTGDARQYRVKYRRPFGKDWEDLDLGTAMDMIADGVIQARQKGWQQEVDGKPCRPRGRALTDLVRQFQQRAGITEKTGTKE